MSAILIYSNIVEYSSVREMSTNGVRPPEQQPIYPQQYPQYPYPPPYFSPFPPPKKDRTAAIVAVVVVLAIGAAIVPMLMSYFMFMAYDDVYMDDFDYETPMAFDSSVEVEGPTKATVQLTNFSRDPAATEFEVIVIRDGTFEGAYQFTNDHDCDLVLKSGQDVGSLSYRDLNNNFELDPGDEISMSDLMPDSSYEVIIVYLPNGYHSTYASFRTPET